MSNKEMENETMLNLDPIDVNADVGGCERASSALDNDCPVFPVDPPIVDLKFVLQNQDLMSYTLQLRGLSDKVDLAILVELARLRSDAIRKLDEARAEANRLARSKGVLTDGDREHARLLRVNASELEDAIKELAEKIDGAMAWMPNVFSPDVPLGDESCNETLRENGEKRAVAFSPRGHHDLAISLDLLDSMRGTKVAGSRYLFLKNEFVTMRFGLITEFIKYLRSQGFVPVIPPYVASPLTLFGSGYYPYFQDQTFMVQGQDYGLIGTSEQSLVAQHMNEILKEEDLPLLYVGESQCFRTEAGAAGRDTRGGFRLHQFGKVEQIIFCTPETSEKWHLRALENEEWLMQKLELPYRVIKSASGDIHPLGWKKYDLEGWFPEYGGYRELTSNTNMSYAQSRRLGIRYKSAEGKKGFPHTISATGFADRLLLCILENYQDSDGSVSVPEMLCPYTGCSRIEPKS